MKIPCQFKIEFRDICGGFYWKSTLVPQFERDNLNHALNDDVDVSADKIIAAQAGIRPTP